MNGRRCQNFTEISNVSIHPGLVGTRTKIKTSAHTSSCPLMLLKLFCIHLISFLQSVHNVAVSCHACLSRSASELESERLAMAADVNSTLDSFEGVLGGTEGVQREVVAEVRSSVY